MFSYFMFQCVSWTEKIKLCELWFSQPWQNESYKNNLFIYPDYVSIYSVVPIIQKNYNMIFYNCEVAKDSQCMHIALSYSEI